MMSPVADARLMIQLRVSWLLALTKTDSRLPFLSDASHKYALVHK